MASSTHTVGRWRRAIAGIGAAALIGGLVGFAPTAANAATTQTITGKVTFSAYKSLKVSKYAWVSVFDSKCNWVDTKSVTWKGNTFTVKTAKTGKLRLQFSDPSRRTSKSPYGLSSAPCGLAKSVYVGKGKKVKHNLAAKADGLIQLTTTKKERIETYFWLYDAKSKKYAGALGYGYPGSYRQAVTPGTYKLAKVKWSKSKRDFVPYKVFGTSSTKLSKGKTVTVTAAKPLSVNFEKGRSAKAKDFSYKAKATVSGTAKVGQRLTIKRSGFPSGTSFTYKWYRSGGAGSDGKIGTGSSYKLTTKEYGAYVYVEITAKKRGVLTQRFYGGKVLKEGSLTQKTGYSLDGLTDGRATVGTKASFTPATFAQGTVSTSYEWVDDQGNTLSTSRSYTPTADQAGRSVALNVNYSKRGYRAKWKVIDVPVAPLTLTETSPQAVTGATWSDDEQRYEAGIGSTIEVTPAAFEQGEADEIAYEWVSDARGWLSDGSGYLLTEDDADTTITVTVTYTKQGYETVTRSFEVHASPLG